MATPIVFAIEHVARWAGPVQSADPLVAGVFRGDLAGSRWLVERMAASTFVALTTGLLFAIALRFLAWPGALAVALTFAFGTSAWSTASRALWQHGPSMLLLTISLWLLLKARERPGAIQYLSIPLALAYIVRPTNQIAIAVLTIYVFIYYRRLFVRYLAGAIPFALFFLAYNLSVYGRPLSTYYSTSPPPVELALHSLLPFAGNLISPSRGLLVFSPVLIFSIAGMIVAIRRRWLYPMHYFLIAIVVLHWMAISLFSAFWWGGHSYGPRLFSDMLPLFAFFLIPAFPLRIRSATAIAFVALLIPSVLIHYRGATTFKVHLWNVEPENIDDAPARVWNWKDPQFLHGLR
jgi:hypothetical protein